MMEDRIEQQLNAEFDQATYEKIKALWQHHSKSEDERSIEGLMSTLSDDCEYVLLPAGVRWRGIVGATQFYQEVLSAFPDIIFDLQNIVIGPQGVYEEAVVTATMQGDWREWKGQGQKLMFSVQIFFPWDTQAEKFAGEIVHLDYEKILRAHSVVKGPEREI